MKAHPLTHHDICNFCDKPFTCHGYLAIKFAAIPNMATCGTCLVEKKDIGHFMIKKCTCKHAFQDRRYGKENRVHNETSKGWQCTVCEKRN